MKKQRKGFGLIYSVLIVLGLTAIASLAIDFGRVQIVKTQLRTAADSAARAAAHELWVNGTSSARDTAVYYAKANKADGTDVVLDRSNDIEFGKWDTKTRTFTVDSSNDINKLNAVHITARRTAARGNAVKLMVANVLGQGTCNVTVDSIVMVVPAISVNQYIPATANPFLAGMPKNSAASLNNPHNSPDYAGDAITPRQSPLAVSMPINEGGEYTFDSITGDARHDPGLAYYSPDGQMSDMGHNTNGSENGIGDIKAPINAMVGVFLSDEAPNKSAPPSSMIDASSESVRSQAIVSPQLKQIFYIGDGLTGTGTGSTQSFKAPPGATRLYLATWDFFEWNNNAGYRNVRVNRPEKIVMVK